MPPAAPAYSRESIWACLPATTRGQSVNLDAHPKGTSFLYSNGRTIVIRDLAHPEIASEYVGHSHAVGVARYSPSGYYIASGDVRGNVRIWDATQPEQILKAEYPILSGAIRDLAWDAESKRIVAVGEGRDRYAAAFLFDSGSSVGEIVGHSKVINSVSIRPTRPFRAVTASDDMSVNFYPGVPYKFGQSHTQHSRFVTTVRYSPTGSHFVSAGLDGKIYLYDGTSGEVVRELVDTAGGETANHRGGIFACSWSADGKQLLTSSADCTTKLWDVEASKVVTTWAFDNSPTPNPIHQQVGNLWSHGASGDHMLSCSLSGELHYLDAATGTVRRTLAGHQKNITAVAYHGPSQSLYTASYDGAIRRWGSDPAVGATVVADTASQVQDLAISASAADAPLVSIHLDDTVRQVTPHEQQSVKLPSQPTSVAVHSGSGIKFIVTAAGLVSVAPGGSAEAVPVAGAPAGATIVATHGAGTLVAVGTPDRAVFVAKVNAATGAVDAGSWAKLDGGPKGAVTALAFGPAGTPAAGLLVSGDSAGKLVVFSSATGGVDAAPSSWTLKLTQWAFHTARITGIAWHPSGNWAASAALDTAVGVWSVERPMANVMVRSAHVDAAVGVAWIGDDRVASVGADACVKVWKIAKMP
ncbi:WD40-repeat-containing domain protein [Blastocladiella britannica]|nr:WD40-repeat-containing domain protein [Blastocladiella britannica]